MRRRGFVDPRNTFWEDIMKQRRLFTTLIAALLVVVSFGLAACGGHASEKAVRQSLEENFSSIKFGGADGDFAKEFEKNIDDSFGPYGIDSAEFTKSYMEGFDYKIGDITVDEQNGKAVAQVSITVKPMMELVESVYHRLMVEAMSLPDDATEDDLNALTGKLIMEGIASLEPKATDVEITYNRASNGDWEPDLESVETAFATAAMGDADPETVRALTGA